MKSHIMTLIAASLLFATTTGGCDSHEGSHEESKGRSTQSTCPPGSTLTYESFGRAFMQSYCTRCHSSALAGSARNNAPIGHDYDTLDGVRAGAEHIDEHAAAGPGAVNTEMPLSAPTPSEEERRRLGEWLACEVAKGHSADDGGAH